MALFPAAAESGSSKQSKDISVRTLLAGAAQYICLAHALQPSKDIYRKSLAVVRQMLPLPFLRAGYLTAPRARSIGSVTETYRRDWFVLDQRSLRQASHMEASLSTAGAGARVVGRCTPGCLIMTLGLRHQPRPPGKATDSDDSIGVEEYQHPIAHLLPCSP